ncbi:MAG: hypothetical protein K0R14_1803 [Burkholderiales bacterium]|nr:hypothetical protein [Burkholderiales bacterium]
MSLVISVNDLKRLGTHTIEERLKAEHEIVVTSYGKNKYALIEYDELIRMQEDRLELAYLKVHEQIEKGESWVETADEHIKRVEKLLSK